LRAITLLMTLPVLALAGSPCMAGGNPPRTGDHGETPSDRRESEADGSDSASTGEREDDGLLAPYYTEEEEGASSSDGGCFDGCGGDMPWMVFGHVLSVPVSHHADPFRNDMVRHSIGGKGAPLSLEVSGGMTTAGGLNGATASARIWTPSPALAGVRYDHLRIEGGGDITLVYPEAGLELLYGLPVTLSAVVCGLAAWEDGRDVLWGGGFGADAGAYILDFLDLSAEYRLAWLRERPLHRGSARLSWNAGRIAAWGGYLVLRNCEGDTEHGPAAGIRVRI
jgi:hypothetical protein